MFFAILPILYSAAVDVSVTIQHYIETPCPTTCAPVGIRGNWNDMKLCLNDAMLDPYRTSCVFTASAQYTGSTNATRCRDPSDPPFFGMRIETDLYFPFEATIAEYREGSSVLLRPRLEPFDEECTIDLVNVTSEIGSCALDRDAPVISTLSYNGSNPDISIDARELQGLTSFGLRAKDTKPAQEEGGVSCEDSAGSIDIIRYDNVTLDFVVGSKSGVMKLSSGAAIALAFTILSIQDPIH